MIFNIISILIVLNIQSELQMVCKYYVLFAWCMRLVGPISTVHCIFRCHTHTHTDARPISETSSDFKKPLH